MRFKTPFILAIMLALAACASSAEGEREARGIAALKDDVRLGEKVDKICFQRNIDGFSNNNRDTVVLSAGVNKDYVVSVLGVCRNLRNAQSIAIDSPLSCVSRNDILIVSESAFSLNDGTGIGPDRCFIDEIYKWDKRAKDEGGDASDLLERRKGNG